MTAAVGGGDYRRGRRASSPKRRATAATAQEEPASFSPRSSPRGKQTLATCALAALSCLATRAASADDLFPTGKNATELLDAAASGETVRERQLSPEQLEALLTRYRTEPNVRDVVIAALHAQGNDPERYRELAHRARLRGLLPNLDLGARRGQGLVLRSTTTDEPSIVPTTDDDLMLFATLRFDLGSLLFAREEVAVARERRFAQGAQQELVRQVVHLYFLRRRLILERDLRGSADISQALRIAEAEALLDTFTDGAFQRMLKRARSR
jgi:hypothetical protein